MQRTKPVNWSVKLTRSLTLTNGEELVTLEDARRVVLAYLTTEVEHFDLANAMRFLLIAAETGRVPDRKAATEQVAIVLRARGVYQRVRGARTFPHFMAHRLRADADAEALALCDLVLIYRALDSVLFIAGNALGPPARTHPSGSGSRRGAFSSGNPVGIVDADP
jgi:hypothetical protein